MGKPGRIAFIGLGAMGRPMVRRLLGDGYTVSVHNRSQGPVDRLAAEGAIPASSATEAMDAADIILTCLPTVESVRDVYAELARKADASQLFADHSTVDVATSRWCSEMLPAFLDAPVSGPPPETAPGELTVMVGGKAADLDRALPAFRSYGALIRLCGPTGAGTATKIVNQLLGAVNIAAAAEAAALGSRLGADPEILLEVVSSSLGSSEMWRRHMPRFMNHDFSNPVPIRLLLKDLRIVTSVGGPMPLAKVAEGLFERLAQIDGAEQDISAVIKVFEAATAP